MSWVNDMDMLASAGVVTFDGPAYIRGEKPRYYGCPPVEYLPDELPPIKSQPIKDEFKPSDTVHNNPKWKKWTFGILGTLAGLLLLVKCKKFNLKNLANKSVKH